MRVIFLSFLILGGCSEKSPVKDEIPNANMSLHLQEEHEFSRSLAYFSENELHNWYQNLKIEGPNNKYMQKIKDFLSKDRSPNKIAKTMVLDKLVFLSRIWQNQNQADKKNCNEKLTGTNSQCSSSRLNQETLDSNFRIVAKLYSPREAQTYIVFVNLSGMASFPDLTLPQIGLLENSQKLQVIEVIPVGTFPNGAALFYLVETERETKHSGSQENTIEIFEFSKRLFQQSKVLLTDISF